MSFSLSLSFYVFVCVCVLVLLMSSLLFFLINCLKGFKSPRLYSGGLRGLEKSHWLTFWVKRSLIGLSWTAKKTAHLLHLSKEPNQNKLTCYSKKTSIEVYTLSAIYSIASGLGIVPSTSCARQPSFSHSASLSSLQVFLFSLAVKIDFKAKQSTCAGFTRGDYDRLWIIFVVLNIFILLGVLPYLRRLTQMQVRKYQSKSWCLAQRWRRVHS